jgi:hypothetical protein
VSLIEAALRGGAVVLLILVAALLLRDARRVPAGVFGALFALGAASYTIVSASIFAVERDCDVIFHKSFRRIQTA